MARAVHRLRLLPLGEMLEDRTRLSLFLESGGHVGHGVDGVHGGPRAGVHLRWGAVGMSQFIAGSYGLFATLAYEHHFADLGRHWSAVDLQLGIEIGL